MLLASDEETTVEVLASPTPTAGTSGSAHILVIMANFSDRTVTCSAADIESSVFSMTSSVAWIYEEMSRGAFTITGDFAGPYTANQPNPRTTTAPCRRV